MGKAGRILGSERPLAENSMATPRLAPVIKPLAQKYRTLIRIVTILGQDVRVLVPGWNPRKKVVVSRDIFPESNRQNLAVDDRFYAFANLKSASPEELVESFTDMQPTRATAQRAIAQKELASAEL